MAVWKRFRHSGFEDRSQPVRPAALVAQGFAKRHERVYVYIDQHYDEHVAHLQRWIRQRSISAQNDGIREMAAMLRDDLKRLGFQEAEIAETGLKEQEKFFVDLLYALSAR